MMKIKKKRYVQRVGCKQSIIFDVLSKIMEKCGNHMNLTFVDLFGGGGSVSANATHFFKHVIYNEIETGLYKLFMKVQDDEFLEGLIRRRVPREEFEKIRDNGYNTPEENMILTTWSFGNNRTGYIYGKKIERRKELTHKIIFSASEKDYKNYIKMYNKEKVGYFNKYDAERYCILPDDDWIQFKKSKNRRYYKFGKKSRYTRKFIKPFNIEKLVEHRGSMKSKIDKKLIEDIKNAQSLQRLERLERLQSLESLEKEKIVLFNKDYGSVELPNNDNCIIYCDPPYRGTMGYESDFNFNRFDNYVNELKDKGYKIFISEYNLGYGKVIREKNKRSFVSKKGQESIEKLYYI